MELSHYLEDLERRLESRLAAPNGTIDEPARHLLLAKCQALTAKLETPFENFQRIVFHTHEVAALRVAIDIGIFDELQKAKLASARELAKSTGADEVLLVRICRVLIGVGFLEENSENHFTATTMAIVLFAESFVASAFKHQFDDGISAVVKLPEFLRNTGFKNPTRSTECAWQLAMNTGLSFFDWLKEHPERLRNFNTTMTGRSQFVNPWFHVFPVKEKLTPESPADSEPVLLVDVGGGKGHDLLAFKQYLGRMEAPGRFVLQDLPETVKDIDGQSNGIEVMAHDFFDTQPVIDARAYYLHQILHDWSDDDCRRILRRLAAAMVKGKSRLLIHENVLPDINVPHMQALIDIHMMTLMGAMERSNQQWHALLESAGFSIVEIWHLGGKSGSLIEAVLDKKVDIFASSDC